MNDQIAHSFIDARRARGEVPAAPVPADIAECFAISAAQRRALGETVGGWKVGQTPDDTPIAAPMYASGFLTSGGLFRMKQGRPMIPEIEIALRLARDIPPRPDKPYTRDDMLDAASELVLGIELIERRIPPNADFRLNFADDLGNIGYVVGPAIKEFRGLDLAKLRCVFRIGGEVKSDRVGGHPKGDPMIPLVRWANKQGDHHGGMKAGQIITLGSLTPMIEMTEPAPLAARLEGFGDIALDVTF